MIEFQEVNNVVNNVETTIFDYTNVGSSKNIKNLYIEGDARADWDVYLNTNKIMRARTSVSNLSKNINMYSYELNINDILEVKATHYESSLANFSVGVKYG